MAFPRQTALQRQLSRQGFRTPGLRDTKLLRSLDKNIDILTKLNILERGYSSRTVTIGTTASRIYSSPFARAIKIINPTRTSGLTTSGTILASAARAESAVGNSALLSIANYNTLRLFLDVSINAVPLAITIDAQTRDPLSLNYATSQGDIFGGSNAVGTYYANLGGNGVDTGFRVAFTLGAGGGADTATFSIGYVLKDGLPGSTSGIDTTVYLGPSSGVNTVSGFPLLEGQNEKFYFRENTEIWGISTASIDLRIIEFI